MADPRIRIWERWEVGGTNQAGEETSQRRYRCLSEMTDKKAMVGGVGVDTYAYMLICG